MKHKLHCLISAVGLLISASTFAQTLPEHALTRAQVRDEMVQYSAAGFNPARQNPRTWVDDAQSASAKVVAERGTSSHVNQLASHDASHCD
ncbi:MULTISPECIES: DUF4148 domain-containing protein [Paraburkholderia]|uniref:DUF4148 domain-containing protein n=1 Tax=Paraburkholderia TaxID=1822464 RepID=UPI002869F0DD|nr:DUF4148 domain-containing protein [Paraburkholderia graminis]